MVRDRVLGNVLLVALAILAIAIVGTHRTVVH
jgi:hypothetical protein